MVVLRIFDPDIVTALNKAEADLLDFTLIDARAVAASRSSTMPQAKITIEQIGNPIRRHCVQRKTLKGLRLNRIGSRRRTAGHTRDPWHDRQGESLIRVVYATSELDAFVDEVTAEYRDILIGPNSQVVRGDVLWEQFEAAVAAYHADHGKDDRRLIECVNEVAVAKVLVDDPALKTARISMNQTCCLVAARSTSLSIAGKTNSMLR